MIMAITELKQTVGLMNSTDYKDRFKAEYYQTKIRYENLKAFCNRIEAAGHMKNQDCHVDPSRIKEPEHDCPYYLLREQQRVMGEYLNILEVRAVIEEIEL